jgi:hypothetical protein
MASVRNAKPTTTPKYPSKGRIHILRSNYMAKSLYLAGGGYLRGVTDVRALIKLRQHKGRVPRVGFEVVERLFGLWELW